MDCREGQLKVVCILRGKGMIRILGVNKGGEEKGQGKGTERVSVWLPFGPIARGVRVVCWKHRGERDRSNDGQVWQKAHQDRQMKSTANCEGAK